MRSNFRWLAAGAAIALFAFLAFRAFGPGLAEQAFGRIADNTLGVDASEELPDGLHVYLCGTGSPIPDPGRAGPCIGVLAGERAFVFDVGSGSVRRLMRMGFPMARLEAAHLTHLHSDHIDGLGELFMQAWIAGGLDAPLPVVGPVGTGEVVDGFNASYRIDDGYRIAHHGEEVANPGGSGGAAVEFDATDGAVRILTDADGLRISAIAVDHAPASPAYAYRIDYGGRSVAISGDTGPGSGFASLAEGADLMLHDALNRDLVARMATAARANGDDRIAKIFDDIQDYHASPREAAETAEEAGVGELVLYHIVPPLPSALLNDLFLGDAAAAFAGDITIGVDGMLFSLPAGGDDIQSRRMR
ncbi:MAG: MBL fold metallo-hydrolase [Alphaproteobacteria bacterium]|nr:MBL fold metallo-hydrolase [Alphaproteobacteria bacterium]